MKLTKKLEKEIREVYDTYWNGYMNGDMDVFSVILDEDVKVIGSTEGEVFFSKQEALSFYLPTADQIAGKAELRNRIITIETTGNLVLVTEQNDFYILIENNWTFYAKGRLSTFFHKKDDNWKIIQQHGSMPDIRAVEGEQFALEKISKENLELRDAVKRRTVELEQKNRDLEIETSLERVRTVAMGMSKPDDMLRVCHVISDQLKLLQIQDIRNVQTIIINESQFEYINYQYFTPYDKNSIEQIDYRLHPVELALAQKMLSSPDAAYTKIFKGKDLQVWRDHRRATHQLPDPLLDEVDAAYYYFYSIGSGAIGLTAYSPVSEEQLSVFRRFRNVFELAYRRYRDIEQAASQAREAQIEASLERVRAVAMAMNKLDDMLTVCRVISEQMSHLDTKEIRNVQTAIFYPEKKTYRNYEYYRLHDKEMVTDVDYTTDKISSKFAQKMQAGAGEFFTESLKGNEVQEWYEFQKTTAQFPDPYLKTSQSLTYYWSSLGPVAMGMSTYAPLTDDEIELFKRFRNVFELAYRRFLDIQQASAQAREAQIELGLERVRARAMAMQKSDELKELIGTVFSELTKLDFVLTRCVIMIFDPSTKDSTWWMANSEAPSDPIGLFVQSHKLPPYLVYIKAWQERNPRLQYVLEGKIKKEWDEYLFTQTGLSKLPDFVIEGMKAPDKVILASSFNNFGNLTLASLETLSEEHSDIMLRFAKVFDLTYTRFNDLLKAESQARESRIEASLERVRAATNAMHQSADLLKVINILSEQFQQLGFNIHSANFNTSYRLKDWNLWLYNPGVAMFPDQIHVPYFDHPYFNRTLESLAKGSDFTALVFNKQEKDSFLDHLYKNTIARHVTEERRKWTYEKPGFAWSVVYLANTAITVANYDAEPYTEEQNAILRRFGNVFEQTYTRFLDLKKAEAQGKEATIEASLERVRGKAMAMHNSNDLASTASMVFTELRKLGIRPIRCGVGLLNKETRKAPLYSATSSADGDSLALVGWVVLSGHPVLENIYNSWLRNEDYFPELSGEQLKTYYENLLSGLSVEVPDWQTGEKQFGHFFPFSIGCLYAWSNVAYNESEIKILKRFGSIIDLTFRRYIELQKSEANAKEAVRQASLDRVRAEIASMRTTTDLEKITPLIWKELKTLDVPFIRCGVFIMDDVQQIIHTYLSTPEGKSIAAFNIPYSTPGNISQVIVNWHANTIYTDHWAENDFEIFAATLVQQKALISADQYLNTIPIGGFYLHFLPFLQGMLYVGNTTPLEGDETKLTQLVADAFSTAYARYEDFNKLESAKEQIEKTLVDLKKAQTQLVQSEKMASLGELTAGIAHEIQNPLNFVNNFSEVSTELLDEMIVELGKNNSVDAMAIADDVKQNLEKILHHGKRADGIVKGMLQHSRTSSGVKEPTNINVLADEYLRLAYHGLRAKDKSFNAVLKTDYDESIGNVEIIPQDIGRVILNLITNAFYAVEEKRKRGEEAYKPTVSVSTKSATGKIEVSVKDNGIGISQKVMDKIFQPFFTTKPTGQGTGLGLSLSYDIIKAHGGELKVETGEGEGSVFIISLPV